MYVFFMFSLYVYLPMYVDLKHCIMFNAEGIFKITLSLPCITLHVHLNVKDNKSRGIPVNACCVSFVNHKVDKLLAFYYCSYGA